MICRMVVLEPLVSVIVPVRDHVAGVREVVSWLDRQTLSKGAYELVVGINGGTRALLDNAAWEVWVSTVFSPSGASDAGGPG
jgi:hypothetical protein